MGRDRDHILPAIINRNGFTKGAEIGVSSGLLTRWMMKRCPDLHLTCVDFWPAEYPHMDGTPRGETEQQKHRRTFMQAHARYMERIRLIEKPSVEAAVDVEDASLDFVFIDADHSYEGCRDDIVAWAPKVRAGGFVIGHDYREDYFPGVVKAVDEAYGRFEVLEDSIWLVRK